MTLSHPARNAQQIWDLNPLLLTLRDSFIAVSFDEEHM